MEFVTISSLKEICGYRDRRSVIRWVTETLCIKMFRVGKNWCVIKSEYESALIAKYGNKQTQTQRKKSKATNVHEQEFLDDLQKFLSHV